MGTLADIFVRVFADDSQAQKTLKTVRSDITALSRRAAEITVKADTRVAEQQVKALRFNLEKLEQKRVMIPIKATGLDAEIASVKRQLELLTQQTYEVPIEAQAAVDREIKQVQRKLARLESRRTKIPAEMENISAEIAATEAELKRLERHRVEIPVKLDFDGRAVQETSIQLARMMKLPALAVGAAVATSAISQLAAGFVSLSGAIAPAAGGLASFPVLLGAAGQAAGVAASSFLGVSDALKELAAAESGASAASQRAAAQEAATAKARESAARRVADAVRAVADAQRQAGRVQERNAEAVRDAEEAIVEARRNSALVAEANAERISDAQRRLADAQRDAADSAVDSAERIADAQERLAEAHANAADTAAEGARRIADAEKRLAASQKSTKVAQEDLNRARQDAVQDLHDLEMALKGASLSEEDAVIGLRRAKQRMNELKSVGSQATKLDLDEAELNLRQAQMRIEEASARRKDLVREVAESDRVGIEGSTRVLDAKEQLADAIDTQRDAERDAAQARKDAADANIDAAKREADAVKDLGEARKDAADAQRDAADAESDAARGLARARRDAARSTLEASRREQDAIEDLASTREDASEAAEDASRAVADAQRNLSEAQKDAADVTRRQALTIDSLAEAMARLSPKAQEFARYLNREWRPALKAIQFKIQDTLFPKLQIALQTVTPLLGVFSAGAVGTAAALGQLAVKGAEMLASGPWKADFATVLSTNNDLLVKFGEAGLSLADAFRSVHVAALPMTQRFADFVVTASDVVNKFIQTKRETGELGKFFGKAGDTISQLGKIIGNVGVSFYNVGKAGSEAGQKILNAFEGATEKFKILTGSDSGQNAMKKIFDETIPAVLELGRLITDITAAFIRLGSDPAIAPLISQIRTQLLPAVEKLFKTAAGELGPQFVDFLTNVVELFTNLSAGGGALSSFVETLNTMVLAFNNLLESPLGPFINLMLRLLGGMLAFGLILGTVARACRAFGVVLRFLGGAARGLANAFRGLVSLGTRLYRSLTPVTRAIGSAGRAVGTAGRLFTRFIRIIRPITRIVGLITVGIRALLVVIALIASPIGLAIAAVAALGVAIALLWKHNETFRNNIKGAWNAIKDSFVRTWNVSIKPALQEFGRWIKEELWPKIRDFKTWLVDDGWPKISGAIKWAWNNVIRPVFSALGGGVDKIKGAFGRLKDGAVRVKDGIKEAWKGLVDAIKVPVNALIDFINGIVIKPINFVVTKLGFDALNEIPKWGRKAAGGVVVGPGTATSDSVPTLLSNGEYVVKASSVKKYGTNFLTAVNEQRLAGGGLVGVGGPLDWAGDAARGTWRGVKTAGGFTKDKVGDAYNWSKEQLGQLARKTLDPILQRLESYIRGAVLPVQLGGGMIRTLINKVIGKADKTASDAASMEELSGAVVGLIGGELSKLVRPLPSGSYRISSNYGLRTHPVTGASKMHKGLDLAAPYGTPVYSPFTGWLQTLRDPGGYGNYVRVRGGAGFTFTGGHLSSFARSGGLVRAGTLIGRVGSTGRSTGPHLHAEFARFGKTVNPRSVMSFDAGGWLPSGGGAINTSGKPERILTSRQTVAFERLIEALEGKTKDQPIQVRVFVGDREIKDIVKVEVGMSSEQLARKALHGRR